MSQELNALILNLNILIQIEYWVIRVVRGEVRCIGYETLYDCAESVLLGLTNLADIQDAEASLGPHTLSSEG